MQYRSIRRAFVYIALISSFTLPALAEPVSSRPVDRYHYLLTYSFTHDGETESSRHRGRFFRSGRRIVGRSYAGCHSFNFRIPQAVLDCAGSTHKHEWREIYNRMQLEPQQPQG